MSLSKVLQVSSRGSHVSVPLLFIKDLHQYSNVCVCHQKKVVLCFRIWSDLIATEPNFPVSAMIKCDVDAERISCVWVCVVHVLVFVCV